MLVAIVFDRNNDVPQTIRVPDTKRNFSDLLPGYTAPVSMTGEVKDPTSLQWKCVICRGHQHPLLPPPIGVLHCIGRDIDTYGRIHMTAILEIQYGRFLRS